MIKLSEECKNVFNPDACSYIANSMIGTKRLLEKYEKQINSCENQITIIERIKKIAVGILICSCFAACVGVFRHTHRISHILGISTVGALTLFVIAMRVKYYCDTLKLKMDQAQKLHTETEGWISDIALICEGEHDKALPALCARIDSVETFYKGQGALPMKGFDFFSMSDPYRSFPAWVGGFMGKALLMGLLKNLRNNPTLDKNAIDEQNKNLKFIKRCCKSQRLGMTMGQRELLWAIKRNQDTSQVSLPNRISPGHWHILELISKVKGGTSRNEYKFDGKGNFILPDVSDPDCIVRSRLDDLGDARYKEYLTRAKEYLESDGELSDFEKGLIEPMLAAKCDEQFINAVFAIEENDVFALMQKCVSYDNQQSNDERDTFFLDGYFDRYRG